MKTASDPRHQHRIKLIQHLYSSAVQNKPDSVISEIWNQLPVIDPQISRAAPEWPLDHLNPIDLAILRLAVFELLIDKRTPYKVIIDEAVELGKQFGGSQSSAFINGALGNIISQHESSA
jgi:N utilization substance protein B